MDKIIERDERNYFRRILFVAVVGLVIAMILKNYFLTVVGIGFLGIPFVMRLNKFDLKYILINLLVILVGAAFGLLISEISWTYRFATNIFVYIFFVFMLNCLAHRFYTDYCIDFLTLFCYFSMSSSYLSKNWDLAFIQFSSQLIMIFVVVTLSFIIFPGYQENKKGTFLEIPCMNNTDLLVHAFIILMFWDFYMLFNWSFAIFALISIWALYANNPRKEIYNSLRSSLKSAYIGCFLTSMFSLILFAKTGNFLVFILFTTGLFGYLLDKARKGSIGDRKKYFGYIMSTAIPMTLYLSNYTAALRDNYLRAITISELFLIQFLVLKILAAIKKSKVNY